MADSTQTATPPSNETHAVSESSSFLRTVCLYDWWLIKAQNDFQGKRLAVAGVSSRKEEAIRVFVSAPIIKRYDVFSLETADGVYVIIKGFINEQRTLENGFAPQVFNSFLFGFPPNWEGYALSCFGEESNAGIDLGNAVPDNVSSIRPEILSDGAEKSIPTSLVLPEESPGNCEKPFPEDECNVLKEMGEVNVAYTYGSVRNRRSARLHNIKVCQQKKQQPASGGPPKHQDKERSSTSTALENCDLDTAVPDSVSAIRPEISSDGVERSIPTSLVSLEVAPGDCEKPFLEEEHNMSNEMGGVNITYGSGRNRHSSGLHNTKVCQQKQPASGGPPKHPDKEWSSTSMALENRDLHTAVPASVSAIHPEISSDGVEKSIPTLVSLEVAPGDCEKPFLEDELNMSNEVGGVNIAYGSGGSRRSSRLHNTKVCQQKQLASGVPPKHPDKERNSTSTALENRDLDTAVPDNVSAIRPEMSSDGVEKSTPTSLVSLEESLGDRKKPFLEDERNMSNEMGGVNVAYGSGRSRRSARLHNIKACHQKQQPDTGGPPKHPDKDQSSTSAALENRDGEGLECPLTPIQSQSKGPVNTLSEQLVKKSASKISRTLSPKTEGHYKKRRVTVKTEAVMPKRKTIKSASSVKSPQERDVSHLNKGSKLKISSVSPESLSFKKSRSGRLLLPPLEFWRNQIPIYNADHEITEIQEGASLVSSCRGSSPSLDRF